MDRSTAKKILNEFTVDIDLKRPGGILSAEKIDSMVMQALKPFMDEGKAFRQVMVNRETGVRSTVYSYQGGRGVKSAVEGVLGSIPEAIGMDPANAPFSISEQRRRQYTETRERILDPRTAAAVQAQALRVGGTAHIDKNTGFTTIFTPTKATSGIHSIIAQGDARYMSGMSSSVMGQASAATPDERAYAMVSRRNMTVEAEQRAKAEFIRQNPNSAMAREAADMKEQDRKEKLEGTARMARGTVLGILTTMAALLATSVGVLTKILGGVMETAKSTTKMMLESARYNLSSQEMAQFKNMAVAMGFDASADNPFSSVLGTLVEKFANPASAGFGGNIASAAAFLQKDTAHLTDFITGNIRDPKAMMYQLLADSMNITLSSRGGVLQYGSPEAAAMANMPEVSKLLGSQGGDIFSRIIAYMKNNGGLQRDATFTAYEMQNFMERAFGVQPGGTANGLVPSTVSIRAGQEGSRQINEFKQIWSGLNDTVFTKLLGYVGQILEILRAALRPFIAKLDPGWEARENAMAVAANAAATNSVMSDINFYMPKGMDFAKAKAAAGFAATAQDMAQFPGVRLNAEKQLQELLGGKAKADAFMMNNVPLIENFKELSRLEAGRNVTLKGIPGFTDDLKGRTIMPNYSRSTVAQRIADAMLAVAQQKATENNTLQMINELGATDPNKVPLIDPMRGRRNLMAYSLMADMSKLAGQTMKGSDTSKAMAALVELWGADKEGKTPKQFIPMMRDRGFTSSQIQAAIDFVSKNAGKNTAKDALLSDLGILGTYIGYGDASVGGGKILADAQTAGLRAGSDFDLKGLLRDAIYKQVMSSFSGTIIDEEEMKTLAGKFYQTREGRIGFDINFFDKERNKRLSVSGDLTNPGVLAQSGDMVGTTITNVAYSTEKQ